MARVLVLGAGGQLGSELVAGARAAGDDVTGLRRAELDITDEAAVTGAVARSGADIVYNAAAYTAVDRAEQEPELAETVNGRAPGWIAAAAARVGAGLVHFSTDYVFDGSATEPIDEATSPNPLGVYGATKLMGEEAVAAAGGRAWVARTAWVYGDGANFVRTVLRVTREKGEMRVVDDQRGSPTWARDLAAASRRLPEAGPPGVYHLTNSGQCTWFEFACAIVEGAGVGALVEPITTADYPTPAARPAYSVLANSRWLALGQPPLRHWREALSEYLSGSEASPA